MSDRDRPQNRRLGFIAAGVLAVALLAAIGIRSLPRMLAPKIVGAKRPAAELVVPAKTPAREALVAQQVSPQTPGSAAAMPLPMASPVAPSAQVSDSSVPNQTVDGEEYIAELDKVVGLTELERSRMQPFLETIARSQEIVERVADANRREDMKRRIQYQAVYGMKLRVAPEKRERVADVLQKGVPRLLFPNAKKPEVVKGKTPVTHG